MAPSILSLQFVYISVIWEIFFYQDSLLLLAVVLSPWDSLRCGLGTFHYLVLVGGGGGCVWVMKILQN